MSNYQWFMAEKKYFLFVGHCIAPLQGYKIFNGILFTQGYTPALRDDALSWQGTFQPRKGMLGYIG